MNMCFHAVPTSLQITIICSNIVNKHIKYV